MRLLFLLFMTYTFLDAGGILEIDWSKVNKSQQKPSIPYPSVLVEGIKEVRLPVYLSSAYAYDKNMIVVAERDFYTVSFLLKGATVLFEGDRTYQESVSPSNKKFQKIVQKSNDVTVTLSEEVRLAEFNRHGANYAISVECDHPETDKRCTEEKFIRGLYHQLVMVGGRP
jgi:hypothetical protein